MNTRHCVVLNLQHHGHLQDFRINKSQNEAILYVENANVILTNFYIHSWFTEMKRGIINRFKAELLQVFGSQTHSDSFSRNEIEVKEHDNVCSSIKRSILGNIESWTITYVGLQKHQYPSEL